MKTGKLRKIICVVLCTCMALTLASCGKGTEKKEKPKEKPKNVMYEKAANLYKGVLDHIGDYDFHESSYALNDVYYYGLVQMDGKKTPQLIVGRTSDFGQLHIIFFAVNDDCTEVFHSKDLFYIGVAAAGGFRGFLEAYKDGNGLYFESHSSGTGMGQEERLTIPKIEKDFVVDHKVEYEGRYDLAPKDDNRIPLVLVDINDRSLIDAFGKMEDGTFSNERVYKEFHDREAYCRPVEQTPSEESKEPETSDSESNTYTLSGTLKHLTGSEVVKMQTGEDGSKYPYDADREMDILYLDKPQVLHIMSGGDPSLRDGDVTMIELKDHDLQKYYNKHITIKFKDKDAHFPSDASIPLGEPRCSIFEIVS